MFKKFFRVRRFVGRVYERYYPNPYLYTRTRPDGDIGLAARDALKRHRYASPYTSSFFSSFFYAYMLQRWQVWCLDWTGSRCL